RSNIRLGQPCGVEGLDHFEGRLIEGVFLREACGFRSGFSTEDSLSIRAINQGLENALASAQKVTRLEVGCGHRTRKPEGRVRVLKLEGELGAGPADSLVVSSEVSRRLVPVWSEGIRGFVTIIELPEAQTELRRQGRSCLKKTR